MVTESKSTTRRVTPTPGSWSWCDPFLPSREDHGYRLIAEVYGGGKKVVYITRDQMAIGPYDAAANAQLIAAAPDLLAALRDARSLIEDASSEFFDASGLLPTHIAGIERTEWQITLERVTAAIAKARGQAGS